MKRIWLIWLVAGTWLMAGCEEPGIVLVVNSFVDASDVAPGDGVCETVPSSGVCSLRAAVEEANALPGRDSVEVPSGSVNLLTLGELVVQESIGLLSVGSSTNARVDADGSSRILDLTDGDLFAERITFVGGAAGEGAGIRLADETSLTLVDSEVADSVADTGAGGIDGGADSEVVLVRSTVAGNTGGTAGGVWVDGNAILIDSTVSTNSATNGVGGMWIGGTGTLKYSTIADNSGTVGGIDAVDPASVTMTASAIESTSGLDCSGLVASGGSNADGDGTCITGVVPGDRTLVDMWLMDLDDYGGPTRTHQPMFSSELIDAIAPGVVDCQTLHTTSQKGEARSVGGRCEIGAVETILEPVSLGSPRNFLGTGLMGTELMPPDGEEGLFLSINGYCTEKQQGDLFAARYANGNAGNTCTGVLNPDYDPDQYQFYIDIPEGRTYDTDIIVFDAHYDTRNDSTGCHDYLEVACDFNPGASSSIANTETRFRLRQADGTPASDADNPYMDTIGACNSGPDMDDGHEVFAPSNNDDASDGYLFNPPGIVSSSDWFLLCQIPVAAPSGRYILEVTNASEGEGSNNFSLVATPSPTTGGQMLCDARVTAHCPTVFAKDNISIRIIAENSMADFFLAEIGAEHAGKTVVANLWDATEGTDSIVVRSPTGSNTWTNATIDYFSSVPTSDTDVTAVPTPGTLYNNQNLMLRWDLPPTYAPPADNAWWRMRFFASNSVTDRTTVSVQVAD